MSTRANITINRRNEQLWFYRHSDGYPDGALPTLCTLLKWVREGKIRDNAGQAAGWLILLGAEEYGSYRDDKFGERPKKTLTEPIYGWKCGAYEPTTGQHGDIEYLYTIDLYSKTITVDELDGNTWDVNDELFERMWRLYDLQMERESETEDIQPTKFRKLVFREEEGEINE